MRAPSSASRFSTSSPRWCRSWRAGRSCTWRSTSPTGSSCCSRSRRPASCCAPSSSSTTAPTARSSRPSAPTSGSGASSGLLVFQPFANWRHNHAVHHGTRRRPRPPRHRRRRDLTVAEYDARPWRGRLAYRLFRNPLVMFGIGPIWSLMIGPRLGRAGAPAPAHSVWLTNLALAVVVGALFSVVGPARWLIVQMPTAILAGTAGVWLFYVQHQFEDVYWESGERLELRRRGAEGQLLPEAAEALSSSSPATSASTTSTTSAPRSPTTTCSAPTTRTRSSSRFPS